MSIVTPAEAVAEVSSAEILATVESAARAADLAGHEAWLRGDSEAAQAHWLDAAAYWADLADIIGRLAGLPTITKEVTHERLY